MEEKKQTDTKKIENDSDVTASSSRMLDLAAAAMRREISRNASSDMAIFATMLGSDEPKIDGQACDPGMRSHLLYRLREEGLVNGEGRFSAIPTSIDFPMELPQVQSRLRSSRSGEMQIAPAARRKKILDALRHTLDEMTLDEHIDAAAEKRALHTLTERLGRCLASFPDDRDRSTLLLEALLTLRHVQGSRIATHSALAKTCEALSADLHVTAKPPAGEQ